MKKTNLFQYKPVWRWYRFSDIPECWIITSINSRTGIGVGQRMIAIIINNNSNKSWYTSAVIPFYLPQANLHCTTGAFGCVIYARWGSQSRNKESFQKLKTKWNSISQAKSAEIRNLVLLVNSRLVLYNFLIRTNECSFGAQKSCSGGLCCIKIFILLSRHLYYLHHAN